MWTYDNAGNITSKKTYAYTTGTLGTPTDTKIYSYSDPSWGDLLIEIDDEMILYDPIGNPIDYGTWTLSWKHGRQFESMVDGSNTISFTYDANLDKSLIAKYGTMH